MSHRSKYDSYRVNHLRELVRQIADPVQREEQDTALTIWADDAPSRYTRFHCPACNALEYNRKGRICHACMEDVIRSRIARCQDAARGEAGEPVAIMATSHWNGYPWVHLEAKLDEGHVFRRGGYGSAQDSFEAILQNLITVTMSGFTAVPAGVQTQRLFGGQTGERVTALAPKGFTDAIRALAFFTGWAVATAKAEGFQRGQNLLGSMADGALTYGDYEMKAAQFVAAMIKAQANAAEMRGRQ